MLSKQRELSAPFDPIPGSELRYRWRTESEFAYLNESARPEMAEVRRCYREWLSRYPDDARPDLVRRFRDEDDRKHTAAAFELALHEALMRLGGRPRALLPTRERTTYEFDVTIDGEDAAVEATVANVESNEARKARRRREAVLDHLDQAPHARVAIHVWELSETPEQQASLSKLRNQLHRMLDGFSADDAAHLARQVAAGEYDDLPRCTIERPGIRLVCSPVPLPPLAAVNPESVPNRRQIEDLPVPAPMLSFPIGKAIQENARQKAEKRYALGERPLILSLACTHWAGASSFEVIRGLFGTTRWPVRIVEGRREVGAPFFDRDGVWAPHSRNRSTSVSALIVVPHFTSADIPPSDWCAYVNPWPRTPAPKWLRQLPHYRENAEGHYMFHPGTSLSALLAP